MDPVAPGMLSTTEALALIQAEAQAERAVADPTKPDPCAWVGNSQQWLATMYGRPLNPLPIFVPGKRGGGGGHRFHSTDVRTWFAEEFERRNAAPGPDAVIVTEGTGVLLTVSALAKEIHLDAPIIQRRLNAANIQPKRRAAVVAWYQLGDMLAAIQAAAKAEDPNSLPPQDRDAHWRAEAREDEVRKNRGELIPVAEALKLINTLASQLRDFYDLIPDTLEGKCGLSPEALAVVERELDDARRANAHTLRDLQAKLTAAAAVPQETTPDTYDLEAA